MYTNWWHDYLQFARRIVRALRGIMVGTISVSLIWLYDYKKTVRINPTVFCLQIIDEKSS